MANFTYRARDSSGSLITGRLEGDKIETIETILDRMGLIPITIKQARDVILRRKMGGFFERITSEDLILFTRQLSTLYKAGLPLLQGLRTLVDQIKKEKFKELIREIVRVIEEGGSFAQALSHHPRVFSEIYVNMVEAGEAAGILDEILDRLTIMIEIDSENRAKIKAATLYPKIVIAAIITAIVILMTFVVPTFAQLYSNFKIPLPLPTRVLISMSNFFVNAWYIIFFSILFIVLSFRWYLKTDRGGYAWDKWKLKLPIFGPITLKSTISRFARVLGSLLRSGIPILQALDIVSRSVGNKPVSKAIKTIEVEVRAGKNISGPMSDVEVFPNLFPSMVIQMVAVGEDTGTLDEMLVKVSDYLDQEVAYTIRNLTTTLEPLLLLLIFAMVLFLALAIFLPMWDLIKLTGR